MDIQDQAMKSVEMQARLEDLQRKLEEVTARLIVVEGKGPSDTAKESHETQRESAHPADVMTRGSMLKLAAAGAAGVVGALELSGTASASTGDPVLAGETVTATSFTQLDASGSSGDVGGLGAKATGAGIALLGHSPGGFGVAGESGSSTGVYASSSSSYGVYALGSLGVYAEGSSNGVHARTFSGSDSGVWGENLGGGYGITGTSDGGIGLVGQTETPPKPTPQLIGILGQAVSGTAIAGQSATGYDLSATGTGRIFIQPQGAAGPPTGGTYNSGEMVFDGIENAYACVFGSGSLFGAVWHSVGNFRPFTASHRVFNGSMTPGQLVSGVSALTDIHGASTFVPTSAIGIYCAVQSYKSGTLTIFADGATEPGSANWSGVGTSGLLNLLYMIVPLSAANKFSIRSHLTATGQVYVDIWGYVL